MLTIVDSEGHSFVLFLKLFPNKKLKTKINTNNVESGKRKLVVATEGCGNVEKGAVDCVRESGRASWK